jgi:hypothetical protein
VADNFLEGAGSVSDPGLSYLAPTLFKGSQELLTSTFAWWSRRLIYLGNTMPTPNFSDKIRV